MISEKQDVQSNVILEKNINILKQKKKKQRDLKIELELWNSENSECDYQRLSLEKRIDNVHVFGFRLFHL